LKRRRRGVYGGTAEAARLGLDESTAAARCCGGDEHGIIFESVFFFSFLFFFLAGHLAGARGLVNGLGCDDDVEYESWPWLIAD
jgi:hypothetical protein